MTRQHLEPTVEQATKIWMEGKDDSGVVETYRRSSYHKVAFMVSCAMLMVVSIVAAIGLGPVKIGFIESIQTLISHMVGEISDPLNDYFIWEGRLPRALMGVLTGAGLDIGGCVRPTPLIVHFEIHCPMIVSVNMADSDLIPLSN